MFFVGTTDDLNSNLPKVPIYGVLNAVEIQALASESLIQGRLLEMLPSPSVLALASFILILLSVVFLSINTISSALVGALSILNCRRPWAYRTELLPARRACCVNPDRHRAGIYRWYLCTFEQ